MLNLLVLRPNRDTVMTSYLCPPNPHRVLSEAYMYVKKSQKMCQQTVEDRGHFYTLPQIASSGNL